MKTFKANYDRVGVIEVRNVCCHVCKAVKDCISIDSSEEEYGPGNICLTCASKMINEYNNYDRRIN